MFESRAFYAGQTALGFVGQNVLLLLFVVGSAYLSFKTVYNLYFHPLSRFPGPRIAAATLLYEFYHDAIRHGQYIWEIQKMHDRYGPIVRISPHELHVNDPEFIDVLYPAGGAVRNKYGYFTNILELSDSAFGTTDHFLHRSRRAPMNKFFSRTSVSALEPRLWERVEKLCSHLENHYSGSGNPVPMTMAYGCFTADIVSEYAFDRNYNLLENPAFASNLTQIFLAGVELSNWIKPMPWIAKLMNAIPDSLVARYDQNVALYNAYKRDIRTMVEEAKAAPNDQGKRTIFEGIIQSDLPEHEKSVDRLWQDGYVLLSAGTLTTAHTLSVITYYVLASPETLANLTTELTRAMPSPYEQYSWSFLESQPYLSAVILEGLRLSFGVPTRLARISPQKPIHFQGEFKGKAIDVDLPPGHPIGMSSGLVHFHEGIFPEAYKFKPGRWLNKDGTRDRSREKYMISFSKGSRQCLGLNLAYCELYLMTAALFRRFGKRMTLFDTALAEVRFDYDVVVTGTRSKKGVKVVVNNQ